MITLYNLEPSRGDRVKWVLNLLKLEYTEEVYERVAQTGLAPQELRQFHASGKAPILKDGDLVLAESGLIVEYLIETYGQDSELAPKSEKESLHIRYGIMSSESNIMIAGLQLHINSLARKKLPWGISFIVGRVLDQIEAGYALKEAHLCLSNLRDTINANGGYYSNGHLTGADIMYNFTVRMFRFFGILPGFSKRYPELVAYSERIQKRIEEAPSTAIKVVHHRKPARL